MGFASISTTALHGCTGPTLVSVTPEYSYVDGCIETVVQGHDLGVFATGAIDGVDFLSLEPAEWDPLRPDHAQDRGFVYFGVVPPGEAGWADVAIRVGGESLTLPDGFYYVTCPASFHVDAVAIPEVAVMVGEELPITGCGLTDAVRVLVYADSAGITGTSDPVATLPLIEVCGSARAVVEVPALAAGTYTLVFVHDDGSTWAGPSSGDPPQVEPLVLNVGPT